MSLEHIEGKYLAFVRLLDKPRYARNYQAVIGISNDAVQPAIAFAGVVHGILTGPEVQRHFDICQIT